MRVAKLVIDGFRSVEHLELDLTEFQTLLGPNNSGKSNVLSALNYFFSSTVRLEQADFHERRDSTHVTEVKVTLTFDALTPGELDRFRKYVLANNVICVSKSARLGGDRVTASEYHGMRRRPEDPRFNLSHYSGSPTERLRGIEHEFPEAAALRGTDRLSNEVLARMLEQVAEAHSAEIRWTEESEAEQFMGPPQNVPSYLGRFLILDPIPDPSNETAAKSGSWFADILKDLVTSLARSAPEYASAIETLRRVAAQFNRVMPDGSPNPSRPAQISQLETDIARSLHDWSVGVELEIAPPEIDRILSQPIVRVDDGHVSALETKGHGLQRAFLLALLTVWRDSLARGSGADLPLAGPPVLIAIEEPELYLHPHRQRTLFKLLRDLSQAPGHQVIVVSHSPYFIDVSRTTSIVRIWKDGANQTRSKRLVTEVFDGAGNASKKRRFQLTQWIDPARGELFFARRVVLVEGATEAAAVPYIASSLGVMDETVSIIPCGGKGAVPIYVELLKAFELEYRVVHDEDPLSANPGDEDYADQRRCFELNQAILSQVGDSSLIKVLSPDFDRLAGVARGRAEKLGKPLAAIEHMQSAGVNPELQDLVRWIYSA